MNHGSTWTSILLLAFAISACGERFSSDAGGGSETGGSATSSGSGGFATGGNSSGSGGFATGGSSSGGHANATSGGSAGQAVGGNMAAGGSGGSAGSDAGGSGGVAGNGGTGGTPGCMVGSPCSGDETCVEPGCCPCLLQCSSGMWQYRACPVCTPICPDATPANGDPCPCGSPASGCDYGGCPDAPEAHAECIDGTWAVTVSACDACCNESSCPPDSTCVAGNCKEVTADGCWHDRECTESGVASICGGDFVCPCNARCAHPDRAGACVPNVSCCDVDADCAADGQRCVRGMCKPPPTEPNGCWSDSDCASGCEGEVVCACGTACLVEDSEGRCL